MHSESDRDRPPLAKNLFDERYQRLLEPFDVLSGILHRLRQMPDDGNSLEEELQKILLEAAGFPPRIGQLVAVRFYLQNLLRHCGDQWAQRSGHTTNFVTLFDRVGHWRYKTNDTVAI